MEERYVGKPNFPQPPETSRARKEHISLGEYEEIPGDSHGDFSTTGLRKSFNGINAVRWLNAKHLENEEEDAQKNARPPPRKVGIGEFILTQHSFFALCFNRNSPPPVMAGCCCVDLSDITDGRQRAFVFVFALLLTLAWSLCMSLVHYNEYVEVILTTLFLLPVILFVKSHIVAFSEWTNGPELMASPLGCVRMEEGILLLLVLGLASLVWEVAFARHEEEGLRDAVDALWFALYVFLVTLVLEIMQLIFQFLFCRSCCPCCVPTKAELIYYERFNAQREEEARLRAAAA